MVRFCRAVKREDAVHVDAPRGVHVDALRGVRCSSTTCDAATSMRCALRHAGAFCD
jgi:hypothetical protein